MYLAPQHTPYTAYSRPYPVTPSPVSTQPRISYSPRAIMDPNYPAKLEPTYLPPSPPPDLSPSASTSYQPVYTFDIPPSTTLLPQPERHLFVHEWSPNEGTQGTSFTVRCDINFPPSLDPADSQSSNQGKALRLVFGTHPVQTHVQLLSGSSSIGGGQTCLLTAAVPSLSSTGVMGKTNRVFVYIQVLNEHHGIVESIQLGEFTYGAKVPYTTYSPAPQSLKRPGDHLESNRPSPNAFVQRRLASNSRIESPEISQYSTVQYQGSPSQTGDWQSPYMQSSASLPSVTQLPPPYSPQPSLMRSTQVGPGLPAPSPYVMPGTAKADLHLQGDLSTMSKGWNTEEWHSRRRLVQFWRRQEGTSIHAAFRPLAQADYASVANSIIISCIFREDKNACFVTSVDAIYLLEALVGTRFTVEEKNRIRRNLEGFRPITVSKAKPGSEEFFKLIMSFPNPKPRNIEKDVKVFPWEILGQALKKIIGKYSASYQGFTQPSPVIYPSPILPMTESYPLESGSAAPSLTSHPSAESYTSNNNYIANPTTPNLSHSHSHSHSNASESPSNHLRQTSNDNPTASNQSSSDLSAIPLAGSHSHSHSHHTSTSDKHDPYAHNGINASPYSQAGLGYWTNDDGVSGNYVPHMSNGLEGGVGGMPGYFDQSPSQVSHHSHPHSQSQSLGNGHGHGLSLDHSLSVPLTHSQLPNSDQGHTAHLPHVHQTVPARPTPNDLRVVYPMSQQQ